MDIGYRILEDHPDHTSTTRISLMDGDEISYRDSYKGNVFPLRLIIEILFDNSDTILNKNFKFLNISFIMLDDNKNKILDKKFSFSRKEIIERFKVHPSLSLVFKSEGELINKGFDCEKMIVHLSSNELVTEEDILKSLNNDEKIYELKILV